MYHHVWNHVEKYGLGFEKMALNFVEFQFSKNFSF